VSFSSLSICYTCAGNFCEFRLHDISKADSHGCFKHSDGYAMGIDDRLAYLIGCLFINILFSHRVLEVLLYISYKLLYRLKCTLPKNCFFFAVELEICIGNRNGNYWDATGPTGFPWNGSDAECTLEMGM